MPKVNCYLDECIHCIDNICTKDEIDLDEEHCGIGGCDDGWEFEEEEDDEDDDHYCGDDGWGIEEEEEDDE